jgi:phosphoglycolate phosphatase-like HAD superfamily hydrolase
VLVLFEVDGTLTRTNALDAELFARAFVETFGAALPTQDWTAYRNVTDLGVAEEGALRALGRRPTAAELGAMRDRFVSMLRVALQAEGASLEVPGASSILTMLREEGRRVAFATGCWEASARVKLGSAGIDVAGIPLASCDEAPERESILAMAIDLAGGAIVYVGDGPWDVAAARRAGVGFVGVDPDGAALLGRAGAFDVVRDFEDGHAFLAALASAHFRMSRRTTAG